MIGSAGSGDMDEDTTNDCIKIADGAVTIFQDDNNKAVVNASGLTVTQGGATAAVFAGTTVIGETGSGKSNIQLTNTSIKLRQGTTDVIEISGSGDIVSNDYLIERSRLFGAGGDGVFAVQDGANSGTTNQDSSYGIFDEDGNK